jgi:hypothetical protein
MGDGEPLGWANFSWHQDVVVLDGADPDLDAFAMAEHEISGQIGEAVATGEFVMPTGIAFASLHPGEVGRAEHPDLNCADPDYDLGLLVHDRQTRAWTVCGIDQWSWRTSCHLVRADDPVAAFLRAFAELDQQASGNLLLAAVHPGHYPALPVGEFADPRIHDESAMRLKAREEWGVCD